MIKCCCTMEIQIHLPPKTVATGLKKRKTEGSGPGNISFRGELSRDKKGSCMT